MLTRAMFLEDLAAPYHWQQYPVKVRTQNDLIAFEKKSYVVVGHDNKFDLPIHITPIGDDCLLIFKNGEVKISRYNYYYAQKRFAFMIDGSWVNYGSIKNKIDSVVFMDNFAYHESFRKYWSEKGLSSEVYKEKAAFLERIRKENELKNTAV